MVKAGIEAPEAFRFSPYLVISESATLNVRRLFDLVDCSAIGREGQKQRPQLSSAAPRDLVWLLSVDVAHIVTEVGVAISHSSLSSSRTGGLPFCCAGGDELSRRCRERSSVGHQTWSRDAHGCRKYTVFCLRLCCALRLAPARD